MIKEIKRALISAFDKTGVADFAKFLESKGVEIVSTGGTARLLKENGIKVREIDDLTGFPEMLDGRVKTLHPKVHGGLLYIRGNAEHEATAKKHNIEPIDLVLIDLYPFEKVAEDEKVEMIDIGGPSMIRSASKNFESVTVITDKTDMAKIQQEIEKNGGTTLDTRRILAGKAFWRTCQFDAEVATFFNPDLKVMFAEKVQDLRYGENPHQQASFYKNAKKNIYPSIVNAKKLHGKELSFNNILDANSALEIATEFNDPFCAILKHTNPCGAAESSNILDAFKNAHAGDPLSAFGGIVVINRSCTKELADVISGAGFFEIIIAPSFDAEALEILTQKKNLRLLEVGEFKNIENEDNIRSVLGGFLVQDRDSKVLVDQDLKGEGNYSEMLFAWKLVKHTKSNAIVITKDKMLVGAGAGQMSRVKSMEIALEKAGEKAQGAICASDAFFPFADSIEVAHKYGIKTIVQPGGSMRDEEVFAKADELGINMVLTGTRSFKH